MEINIHKNIINTIHEIELLCFPLIKCQDTLIHGINHLRRVAYLSGRLANFLGLDYFEAVLAGYLHDCARTSDQDSFLHAHESANLAKTIIERNWPKINTSKIYNAIYYHADGLISNEPIYGCVWDADRLNLIRLGIIPEIKLLSTKVAKRYHSIFIKNNILFPKINDIIQNIKKQRLETGKAAIGIWFTEHTNIILQIILESLSDFNFSHLTIISLFEYENIPKNHDQSCCYQIYKACSHKLTSDQIICPMHDGASLESINSKNIPSIISYEFPYYPILNPLLVKDNVINTHPINILTRDYLSRFFEKFLNTPYSIITLKKELYNNLNASIVLIGNSHIGDNNQKIKSIIPEKWRNNLFNFNYYSMNF